MAVPKNENQNSLRHRAQSGVAIATLITSIVAVSITSCSGKSSTTDATIAGVQTFTGLVRTHVTGPVQYPQTPPVGGEHSPVWLNCGIYSQPVPNENAVHSMEHSAVWVTYDPAVITGNQLTALRAAMPKTYAILSPYPGIPAPIVLSAWGEQLKVKSVDDPRIAEFLSKYRESKWAPEPSSPCTGGLDAPGKVS
ncbi:MAG TPA: DUF3105 domain-containing protein [Candidatus Nanopelagicaceae bacterium]|nr:DUF3105 domain-containing protein [Candidatus Nanopelagicaceae bacterium]